MLSRAALLLQEPGFTTFGELLNFQRFPSHPSTDENVRSWFAGPEQEPETFCQNAIYLDSVVEPCGFAYKDVVHPFVVTEWLRSRHHFRVLRIRRNLADVAIAMLRLNWLYPTKAAKCAEDVETSLIEGLIRADRALSTLRGATVEYEDLIRDGAALSSSLSELYPECNVPAIRFRNRQFEEERAKTLARRESPRFREIERKLHDLQARLASGAPGKPAPSP